MRHSYVHTQPKIEEALIKEEELLAKLYSCNSCCNREQLQKLMDRELGELIEIKMKISELSKNAIMEGMRLDGVQNPRSLWAEEIAPKLPDFTLHTLREQAPVASPSADSGKREVGTRGDSKRNVIRVVTVSGAALTVVASAMNPVHLSLLSLGIVVTATGVVLLVKNNKSASKSVANPDAKENDETAQIAVLLEKMIEQNGEEIRQWNRKLYELAVKAMDKQGMEGEV